MEQKSKRELLGIIEEQDDRLVKFEKRLRDVIHAYKSLAKEKDALEATVKTLSQTQWSSDGRQTDGRANEKKSPVAKGPDTPVPTDPLGAAQEDHGINVEEDGSPNEVATAGDCRNEACMAQKLNLEKLHVHIQTLSSSLATVTEEKSKMEAAFQADKKSVIKEHEAKLKELNQKIADISEQALVSEEQLKQLKDHLRHQQSEREAEQATHSAMLYEFQQLVTVERIEKEELRSKLIERDKAPKNDKSKEYEDQIRALSGELENMSIRLLKSEETASQPSPLLIQLSQEMNEMKLQHAVALQMEQKRANEAEERLQTYSLLEEKRIAELETKLSELSEIVGNYDRMRQQDQVVISKLKERLAQLDVENEALTRQGSFSMPEREVEDNRKMTDLQEQVTKLKGILKMNIKKSEKLGDEESLSMSDIDELLRNDPTHKVCQAEYRQLKEEFERYKFKAQSKLRSGSTDKTEDVQLLTNKVSSLQSELENLSRFIDEKEKENLQIISKLQCELTAGEELRMQELNTAHEDYQAKLALLNLQVKKQRERTEHLLQEKDEDIKRMKERLQMVTPEFGARDNALLNYERVSAQETTQEEDVVQLLDRQSSGVAEGSLFHYSQMITKLEEELADLRKEKYDLEFALRDGEHREEKVLHQMSALKEEIRKLERDRSRESANMEYLKNVILRYILTDSASVKAQMTSAISVVLQLSPAELNEIRKKQGGWWTS